MTNSIRSGSIIYLECENQGKTMGKQQIPYHWTCVWQFKTTIVGAVLRCKGNLQGADELSFLAFNQYKDSCRSSCAWNFTEQGAYQYMDGIWNLRYNWPNKD